MMRGDPMIEFILARYNYWIVVILMMTGLYIVFSRGNLVKTVVGLNLFQTSVFIFYITVGKVAGGTAPILIGSAKAEDHGDGHDNGHADPAHQATPHGKSHGVHDEGALSSGAQGAQVSDLHGEFLSGAEQIDRAAESSVPGAEATAPSDDGPLSREDAEAFVRGDRANEIPVNEPGALTGPAEIQNSIHEVSGASVTNSLFNDEDRRSQDVDPSPAEDVTLSVASESGAETHGAAEAAGAASEILYSNPLPHVLILTAIVVGVATTAVGLAIAVRIREAYGTIEEDDLERLDNEAATGSPSGEGGTP